MAFKLRRAQILGDLILFFYFFHFRFYQAVSTRTEFNSRNAKKIKRKKRTVRYVFAGAQSDLLGIRTNVMIRKVSNFH